VAKEEVMPVTANTTFRKFMIAALSTPTVEKRSSLNRNIRPSPERISKIGPPVSPSASNLNEA